MLSALLSTSSPNFAQTVLRDVGSVSGINQPPVVFAVILSNTNVLESTIVPTPRISHLKILTLPICIALLLQDTYKAFVAHSVLGILCLRTPVATPLFIVQLSARRTTGDTTKTRSTRNTTFSPRTAAGLAIRRATKGGLCILPPHRASHHLPSLTMRLTLRSKPAITTTSLTP